MYVTILISNSRSVKLVTPHPMVVPSSSGLPGLLIWHLAIFYRDTLKIGVTGDWDFQISDLVKNPDGSDYLSPIVNFGKVRRAQVAKSTLFTSTLVPLESFQIFLRSVQMLKREWGAESNGKLPNLFILSETATCFLSLRRKTCLWADLQPWCLSSQWKNCPWAEPSDDDHIKDQVYVPLFALRNRIRAALAIIYKDMLQREWEENVLSSQRGSHKAMSTHWTPLIANRKLD